MMAAVVIAVIAMLFASQAAHRVHQRASLAHHPVPGLPADDRSGAGGRRLRRAHPEGLRLRRDRLLGADRDPQPARRARPRQAPPPASAAPAGRRRDAAGCSAACRCPPTPCPRRRCSAPRSGTWWAECSASRAPRQRDHDAAQRSRLARPAAAPERILAKLRDEPAPRASASGAAGSKGHGRGAQGGLARCASKASWTSCASGLRQPRERARERTVLDALELFKRHAVELALVVDALGRFRASSRAPTCWKRSPASFPTKANDHHNLQRNPLVLSSGVVVPHLASQDVAPVANLLRTVD